MFEAQFCCPREQLQATFLLKELKKEKKCAAFLLYPLFIFPFLMVSNTVYKHFTELDSDSRSCNFCGLVMKTKDRRRFIKHLAGPCKGVTPLLKASMARRYASLTAGSSLPVSSPRSIANHFDLVSADEKVAIDQQLATTFYELGLPISLVESQNFKDLLHCLRPAYQPPARKKLAGPLLDSKYETMLQEMNSFLASPEGKNITLVTDGWTNVRGEAIINYVFVTPTGKAFFYKSVPSHTEAHTSKYLADEIIKVIEEVGKEKFIALCTDSAANMKRAREEVVRQHPHIYAIGCNSHQFNLVIKDILKIPAFKAPMEAAIKVAKWF